jgi:hypothetical protein
MSNCNINNYNQCFVTNAGELFYQIAQCSVYNAQLLQANANRYHNAFCPPNPYCFTPSPPLPYNETDLCNFNSIYKKYALCCYTPISSCF